MSYTYNWNSAFIQNVNTLDLNNLDLCLEIGCFEGLTSNYIANNLLKPEGKLVCVDPLADSYLVENISEKDIEDNKKEWGYFKGQYERFIENTKSNIENKKIELHRELSSESFPKLKKIYLNQFDFIYIDGDHRDFAVYFDAINSFELCKKGGYILFDDYLWKDSLNHRTTKDGIDRFLREYEDKIEVIFGNYQLMTRKK